MRRFRYAIAALIFLVLLLSFLFLLHSSDWRPVDQDTWFAFALPKDAAPTFPFDVSPEAPAGKHGFVRTSEEGQFVLENGERIRFWGVGVGQQLLCPTHEVADRMAERLAGFGVNLVRVQGLDAVIFDGQKGNTRSLDPEKLDRFDYLVAGLKEHGIYVDIVLATFRRFESGDGVVDWDAPTLRGSYEKERLLRSIAFFDPYVLALQREFADQLLSHRNPYTGNTYAEEPSVAMIEIVNETTLMYGWLRDYLNSDSQESIHITSYYSRELDVLWNLWLQDNYGTRAALEESWRSGDLGLRGLLGEENPTESTVRRILYLERASYSEKRVADLLDFYLNLEREYFTGFAAFLKEGLGVRVPVSGTHTFHGMAGQPVQALLDFVGMHVQWQHPIVPQGQTWDDPFRILNTAMVRGESESIPYRADWIETRNTLFRIAYGVAALGKPLVVSEYNHALPNEYRAEFPLILAAYANLQDWDGVIVHEYGFASSHLEESFLHSPFTIANDPVIMAQMPIASLLFRAGYVQRAERTELVPYTADESAEAFLSFGLDIHRQLAWKGVDPEVSLIHKVRNVYGDAHESEDRLQGHEESPFLSDTAELTWDVEHGLVLVDADSVQAAIGYLGGRTIRLRDLTLQVSTDFSVVSLVALDAQPIDSSRSLLLTAVSRAKNTDMVLKRDHLGFYLLEDWGNPPILVEGVEGRIELQNMAPEGLRVYRLGEQGSATSEISTEQGEGSIRFEIPGNTPALWYWISWSP